MMAPANSKRRRRRLSRQDVGGLSLNSYSPRMFQMLGFPLGMRRNAVIDRS